MGKLNSTLMNYVDNECYRYCEWEDYPDKKEQAHKILVSRRFPPPPEFQLAPVPSGNPILEGKIL